MAKESFDVFKIYFNSIHGQRVKSNTVANLGRLCVGLLECNFWKPSLQFTLIIRRTETPIRRALDTTILVVRNAIYFGQYFMK